MVSVYDIRYNLRRLGLAAEKQAVPLACLHLHRDMTTRDGGSMAQELWRNVVGYEGLYMVSNLGNVMSLPRRANHIGGSRLSEGRMLRPSMVHNGYQIVTLCKDGTRTSRLVHRLVAEAFIPNPDNLPQVNHKNFDRVCNTVDNLEWCTASENTKYSESAGRLHHQGKRVVRDDGKVYDSIADAARDCGVDRSCVTVAIRNKGKSGKPRTAGGHSFEYLEE